MTKPEIDEAMVEAGARACSDYCMSPKGGRFGKPIPWSDQHESVKEQFRAYARAVLEAALPMALAAERERCAEVVEGFDRYGSASIATAIREGER